MQKKIIALAVAGLVSGAAFAQQSNVTIYGIVDTYYAHGNGDSNAADSTNVLNAGGLSGSRLGFKGTENLGNGLTAVWTYELGTLDQTSGDNTNFGINNTRQSFIGLTGGFGTFVAGRLQTMGYNFGVKYDAHGASIFSPLGQLSDNNTGAGIGLSVSGRDALARQNNTMAYVSPNMSGFTVAAAYSFGTGGENADDNVAGTDPQNIWAMSVDYDMGPLSVGFVHHNVNDFQGAADLDQTETGIGLNYNFGVAKFFGSYQVSKTEAGSTDLADVKLWNLGVRVPVGANGSVGFAYAQLKDDDANGKAKSWGLDYQYSLSKRTTAYAGYSQVSNSNNNTSYQLLNVNSAAGADGKESQIAVGLRHTF
jgi:predicted porin